MEYEVLIVDDEQEIREGLFHFAWADIGFHPSGMASNGEEALGLLKQQSIDVVLCDIKMDKMDGIEFAKAVYELGIPVYIVFLTGYKDMGLIRSAMHYGCYDYLLKPTRFSQLIEVFTELSERLKKRNGERVESEIVFCPESTDAIIDSVKKLISSRLSTICLEELSECLALSPQYISTLFRDKTGKKFASYRQEVRMKRAQELLLDPRNDINDISIEVGYNNPANFTRAFRTWFGYCPSEYRKHLTLRNDM